MTFHLLPCKSCKARVAVGYVAGLDSNLALYGKDTKLVLPMSLLVGEFKVTKASQAGITMGTGRKWDVAEAVSQAKSRLQHREIVGMVD